MRKELRHVLRTPRRWEGGLRRSALARAIQGSNSIEGYQVAEDDAAAAVEGEEPISADEKTFLEIQGYRQALGYVLAMGDDDYATFDATEIRAMHYMMLSHDLSKSPGRYRNGPIYVRDERRDGRLRRAGRRTGSRLIDALVESLHSGAQQRSSGALRDGPPEPRYDPPVPGRERADGARPGDIGADPFGHRRARVLQHRGMARGNTEDYYSVLAHTGHGPGSRATIPTSG